MGQLEKIIVDVDVTTIKC